MNTPSPTSEFFKLPAPLYYLQNGQIWRLDPDMQTTRQITHESAPVVSFDLSSNSTLAYVSDNSLITCQVEGHDRQVLRAGPTLPFVNDEVGSLNNPDHINNALYTPCWSPDGQKIAFIENGLQIYNLETGQAEMVWQQLTTVSEPVLFDGVLSWSPNGRFLIVSQYQYPLEGEHQRWQSLLELGEYLYPNMSSRKGSTFAWNPDASDLFIAKALFGSDRSLLRCKPETAQCRMIAEFEPARRYFFYAHPFVNAEGRLLVFMGSSNEPVEPPVGFSLISLRPDGYERKKLRNDSYQIESALWSPDGSGVLIVTAQETDTAPKGQLLWLSVEDVPAVPLSLHEVTNLRWGID